MNDEEFLEKTSKWADEGINLFLNSISIEELGPVEKIMVDAYKRSMEETKDIEERLILQLTVLSGTTTYMAKYLKNLR